MAVKISALGVVRTRYFKHLRDTGDVPYPGYVAVSPDPIDDTGKWDTPVAVIPIKDIRDLADELHALVHDLYDGMTEGERFDRLWDMPNYIRQCWLHEEKPLQYPEREAA